MPAILNKLLLTILLIPFLNPACAQASWQDVGYIHKAFNEIALKNEYNDKQQRIKKWQQPIYYRTLFFQMPPYPPADDYVDIHLRHLASITKLSIQPALHKPANLTIIFVQDKHYKTAIQKYTPSNIANLSRESNCMGQIRTNKHSDIIQATVIIPIDHAMSRGLLMSCIVEELTQVMGLPNDSDWVNPSIANDKSKIEFLTGLDYILLTTLYSPNIQSGMNAKQLDKPLKQTLERLERSGIIKQASKRVNSQGLYPYSNN